MDNRILSQLPHIPHIKKVTFGNFFAFKIESNVLKAQIAKRVLSSLLIFDEGFEALASLFAKEPIDGFINIAFEWILRYTYVQHNYLLFCFRADSTEHQLLKVIGEKSTVMINKYTQEMYLVEFNFSNEMFNGTLLDGILLKDDCQYPDYFESTYRPSSDHASTPIPSQLKEVYDGYVKQYTQNKKNGEQYAFNSKREIFFRDQPEHYLYYSLEFPLDVIDIFTIYYEPYRNQFGEQVVQPKEKVVVTDIPTIWENYKEITRTIDMKDVYKQARLPPMHVFHVQAVYQLLGKKTSYSIDKLVDSVSYHTLLNIQQTLIQTDKHWVKDCQPPQPFTIKNSIDTMYYTRHTQVDLRNPFHNDYLRYHPRFPPSHPESEQEYNHFIPEMTSKGELWSDVYTLGNQLVQCVLNKTKFPYVYSLTSKDKRVKHFEFAKVYTLEGRRYIRVILNKIRSDRNKPVKMKCRSVILRKTGEIQGWVPVMYN